MTATPVKPSRARTGAEKPSGMTAADIAQIMNSLPSPTPASVFERFVPPLIMAVLLGLGTFMWSATTKSSDTLIQLVTKVETLQATLVEMKVSTGDMSKEQTMLAAGVASNQARVTSLETEQSRIKDRLYTLETGKRPGGERP